MSNDSKRWCVVGGLLLTLVGAIVAAWNVMIAPQDATIVAGTYRDFNPLLYKSLLAQSRNASIGLGMVAIGTLLQVIGTIEWPHRTHQGGRRAIHLREGRP